MKYYLISFIFLSFFSRPVLSQTMDYDPDLWLPDTIHTVLGNTIELYNDNIAFIRLNDTLIHFTWTHEKGLSDMNKFYWTTDQVGNEKLTIKCFYNNELIDSASTVLKVVDKIIAEKKNLLVIGNSLTASGFEYQFLQISNDLNFKVNPIGTQGDNNKHEGHPGWMFSTFLSSKSPFFIQNAINFKKYIEINDLPNPDIIRITLGINDCYQKLTIDKIDSDAAQLIDTINHDYPNSLIVIALPTLCENTGAGWIASYGNLENFERYQLRVRELWKRLYAKYSYGKYKPNIQISFDGLVIDRANGYPINNGVHPNQAGYMQLIRGLSNTLNYYLNN
jgi:hypothetical protein